MRGVENNIRIRQIKLLGYSNDAKVNQEAISTMKKQTNGHHIQQKYCELETLRVFRVLTNQVFGKLIINPERPSSNQNFAASMVESHIDSPAAGDSLDLREHMVGILFSRSKLTHLQKQVNDLSLSIHINYDGKCENFHNIYFFLTFTDNCSHCAFNSERNTEIA